MNRKKDFDIGLYAEGNVNMTGGTILWSSSDGYALEIDKNNCGESILNLDGGTMQGEIFLLVLLEKWISQAVF
ncbi:MAG: hypothetical protein A2Y10_17755 [Planctomycetes bacterium GWF2_41_51]|nr:MAG: hypothetical protein A2Y10_17755 [Planctomycetes bacterium GWF2_41_51]HBG25904.1 hypothetical protein [Phycisphaerales bacterium]